MYFRTRTYAYDEWIAQGLRLWDYCPATGEYILTPFPDVITPQQARLLSYSSIHDLTPQQLEILEIEDDRTDHTTTTRPPP